MSHCQFVATKREHGQGVIFGKGAGACYQGRYLTGILAGRLCLDSPS
jgi:uncharacterized protein (DUF169 family)